MAYELGDNVVGYEEEVLDLIDKGFSKDRPGIMGREIASSGDLNVEITAGPRMRSPAFGNDVQIVAGPRTNAATLGASASDVAAVALGIPIAAAASYGIYKGVSALTADSGPSTSKPWLYKMGPSYWMSSARKRQFMRAEKEGGVANVEKQEELAVAERAYKATEGARAKESQLQRYQRAIEGKGPLEEPAAAAAPAAEPATTSGEERAMNRDAVILGALKAAGIPITANSYLGPSEMMRATNIVAKVVGPENARDWMVRFMSRQKISYGSPDGSTYEIQGGKPTLVSPSSPSDISMSTNAQQGKANMKTTTSGARSPWEKSLGNPTARSLAMSTMMPTTGVRGGASSPWEKRTTFRTVRNLGFSTSMPTTGVRGEDADAASAEATALFNKLDQIGDKRDAKSLATKARIYKRLSQLTGLKVKTEAGMFVGFASPWEKSLSNPTVRNLAMRTSMRTTGVRGASPWEKGLADPTARNLAMRTSMPTTGIRGARVGAAGPSPMEAKVLNQIVATHGPTITQIVNAKNLGMKRKWSPSDVDIVAAGLMQKMAAETGRPASAADANISRATVRFWLAKAGGSVSGVGLFVGGNNVGDFWSGLKTVALSPITVPYWLGKKAVQGVAWTGRKIFGGGGGASPAQQRQAALAAAAKRNAAAQLRVAAAEKRQQAALMENEQAKDVADQEAAAMEAEAAAQAAESVAITTEATKNVAYKPESLSGWTVVGHCPPSRVGKAALAAATNTPVGRRLRIGAFVGRAMKTNPTVRRQVAAIVGQAKAGNPKAKRQVSTIRAGIVADKQKTAAVKTNAMVARAVATHEKRKLVALGVSPIGLFSKIRVPSLAALKARAQSPITFGGTFVGRSKQTFVGRSKQTFVGNVPPGIPGVPPDIMVALTASSNTFGIPPAVAASVIAAAKSGDPKARKELNDAARVYKAAQKGDPVARKQLAAVAADMKSGYAPAAEKAAVMSAAIGATKGKANYDKRQKAAAAQKSRAVAAAVVQTPLASPCTPIWKCPISFGGRTLWS